MSWYKDGKELRTHSEVRREFPNMSLPRELTDDIIAEQLGVPKIIEEAAPVVDEDTQLVEESLVEEAGEFRRRYTARDLTQEEIKAWRQSASAPALNCVLILIKQGLWGQVEATIDAIPDEAARQVAQARLRYTAMWKRKSKMVSDIGAILGLNARQMDRLFLRAIRAEGVAEESAEDSPSELPA